MQPRPAISTSRRPSFSAKRWLGYGGLLSIGLLLSLPLSAQGRTFGELFQVPAYERNNVIRRGGGEFFMEPSPGQTDCSTMSRSSTPLSQNSDTSTAAQRRLYRFGPGAENFPGQPNSAVGSDQGSSTSSSSSITANSSLGTSSGTSSSVQSQVTNSGINSGSGMMSNQTQASTGGTAIAGCQAIQ